jgi:hypothetical protein
VSMLCTVLLTFSLFSIIPGIMNSNNITDINSEISNSINDVMDSFHTVHEKPRDGYN